VTSPAPVGVLGGSGFYEFLTDAQTRVVTTPYGEPSAPLVVGDIDGLPVVFLARHGLHHEFPAHRVNYRANLWALREAGVTRVISPCAVGSLRADVHPGEFVVLSQLVDRTWGRDDTYCDGPDLHHVGFADPYCPTLGAALATATRGRGITVHEGGTVVVIKGPRFSTRAESASYRAQGWDVINMTQYPEAALARELGVCFGGLALVTDYDTGVDDAPEVEAVGMDSVLAVLRANVDKVRAVITDAITALAGAPASTCRCHEGLAPHLAQP
jgi:5'-methylthioadenosine phosphorylase